MLHAASHHAPRPAPPVTAREPLTGCDPELRDQATRAAKSAFLNLSEGLPSDLAGVRRRYFRQSDGSLHEVVAAVDLARVLDAIDRATAAELQQLAKRLRQMLRGLLRAGSANR